MREEDALSDREVLDQVELLVDRRHPAGQGRGQIARRERLSLEEDLPGGRLDRSGHALDQRRLAGAVGTEQTVDHPRVDLEAHAAQSRDPGVLLDQVS